MQVQAGTGPPMSFPLSTWCGAEMDEAMNNDMTGVTEAGYADKIASGIDRVQGDYSTLPRWMQEMLDVCSFDSKVDPGSRLSKPLISCGLSPKNAMWPSLLMITPNWRYRPGAMACMWGRMTPAAPKPVKSLAMTPSLG